MPTYEYECTNPRCRHRWDLFQSIKAEPERDCPKCAKRTATRLIGIGAAILSGGRAAEPAESSAPAAKPAEASTAPAASAKDSAAAAGPAKADAAKPESTKPAAAEKSADTGKVNATHPAREGRGAGNLRDAIRRQRATGQPSARKAPAAAAKRTAPRTGGARRGK
ncbi:MAG: zinc ribbon domain-containing protein [Phycisphaerales bacterium]|nr:zinc ribbon domain-containing protein [Phycisphaerales bacterium]